MRELKFRAWSNEYDHYCSGLQYDTDFGWEGILESEFEYQTDPEPVIEQYTGLNDKNGKEIYEGDIIDYNSDGDCIGVVKYEAPEFILTQTNNWGTMFLKGECHQTVIGNIHENPELLEGKE